MISNDVYLIIKSNVDNDWDDEDATVYRYGSTVSNFKKMENRPKVVVTRKIDGQLRIIGYGRVGNVTEIGTYETKHRQATNFEVPYEEWSLIDPPREIRPDVLIEMQEFPSYNVQSSILPITKDIFEKLIGVDGRAEETIQPEENRVMGNPLNQILYGPPGTGKTYHTARIAVEICDGSFPSDRVELMIRYRELVSNHRVRFVSFHQSFSYEDFVEGIRPVLSNEQESEFSNLHYECRDGIFKEICNVASGKSVRGTGEINIDVAEGEENLNHVLIIDEINRANISKVLGELITLLEPDKRIDSVNELRVRLPYSREMFGIPANLYLVGTMNTADRSIALLDTALRRRFVFTEMIPDVSLIQGDDGEGNIQDGQGGSINLRDMLEAINERVRYLLNRDQMIGHAYLMPVRTFPELCHVLCVQIIPLLQEYFYEDWHRIQLIFRDVDADNRAIEPQIICHKVVAELEILGFDHDEYEDGVEYWVTDETKIIPSAIRNIYDA